ncbi:MAG: hypothetical protein JSV16_13870, partial [Candidatus Hydrogenedentota bacterium]
MMVEREKAVHKSTGLILLLSLLFLATPTVATSEESGQNEHGETHGHRHHVALFLGNTHAEGEDEFTIGVDYEYRMDQSVGVGGVIDYAGGDLESTVVAGGLFLHPYRGLRLLLAPGFENKHGENEFLFRIGASYQFPIFDGWTIAPTFNVDFVDGEEAKQVGIGLGRG